MDQLYCGFCNIFTPRSSILVTFLLNLRIPALRENSLLLYMLLLLPLQGVKLAQTLLGVALPANASVCVDCRSSIFLTTDCVVAWKQQ